MAFTHLHVHSMYSTFDGMIKPAELFCRANELGMKGIALTDHGNMYGAAEFLSEAKKYPKIKPIVGCELYIYDDDSSGRKYHLIALAKNITGYRNLCKIVTIANTQPTPQGIMGRMLEKARGYKSRLHRSDLEKYSEGLIITSACIGGDIPQAIIDGDLAKAKALVRWYKSVFGPDFYLEVSQHKSEKKDYKSTLLYKQMKANEAIFRLGEEFAVKVVATNDVHFLNSEDALAHDVRLCLSTKSKMSDVNRFQYTGQEYLKTEEEMLAIFPEHPDAIENTMEVYEKVERYDIQSDPLFPKPYLPKDMSRADEYLSSISREGLCKRVNGNVHPEDMMRLERELEVVRQKHCAEYFLMLKEIIDAAREKGIAVGPGRGQSPSLTLNYALGLTDLLPSRFGLLSEHCFHRESEAPYPDINFDFSLTCDGDKGSLETIYEMCQAKYGHDHVAKVIIFNRFNRLTAIKEVFRAMGCGIDSPAKLVKALPKSIPLSLSLASILKAEKEGEGLRSWYKGASQKERLALEISDKLTGIVLDASVHSSGVAVCSRALSELMPMQRIGGQIVGQYDGHYIESLGVIKLDFLGLSVLDTIKNASSKGPESYDDPRVYDYLANGDTQGIFRLGSEGLSKWVKILKPTNLDHLAALDALYRPYCFKYLAFYIEAKQKSLYYERAPKFCRACLEPTFGLLLFKEQALKIAKLCQFSDKEADALCKALTGNRESANSRYRDKFLMGAISIGACLEDAHKAWALMMEFGPTLYSYSHALSYATLTYKTSFTPLAGGGLRR